MHGINLKDGKFDILWKDKVIIGGVRPLICLEDTNSYTPDFVKECVINGEDILGKYIEHILHYGNEDSVEFSISLKCYEAFLLAGVKAAQRVDVFRPAKSLLSVGGLKLQIDGLCQCEGIMANYMFCNWWTKPFFSKTVSDIPQRTNSILWKEEYYHHMLPLCGDIFKSEFQGNGTGMEVVISAYTSGYKTCDTLSFVLGSSNDPYEISNKTTEAGFAVCGASGKSRENRRYPEILEYLGWCSWDAFYHEVNSKGIEDKAEEFKAAGLPLKWIMIDDGWSELKDRKLMSYKEDISKFPEGLRGLIDRLKGEYGVNWVGVWHAYTGYWNGVHPESSLAKEMKDNLLEVNNGMLLPYPQAEKGFRFWNEWHRYLKKQGVDFVKVDNQSSAIEFYKSNVPVGKLARETHEALEASVGINFDNTIINCMGMGLEDIWNRPISAVSRNSDDFYPRRENNFKDHALQNVYNSFYHGNFMWGDWDMWWSVHEQDINNAVLRAVSGGPVYVSDGIGKTDANKLWPLILQDGKVLRCDQPGRATEDCLVHNPNEEAIPLKVWNTIGGNGVIGVFNINLKGDTVEGKVGPCDVPGINGNKFVVYSHFKKEAVIVGKDEKVSFTLEDNGVDLYIIIPIKGSVTPLGLTDKYISPGVILSLQCDDSKALVVLKEGGLFSFAAHNAPSSVLVNGKETAFSNANGIFMVDCSEIKDTVCVEIKM